MRRLLVILLCIILITLAGCEQKEQGFSLDDIEHFLILMESPIMEPLILYNESDKDRFDVLIGILSAAEKTAEIPQNTEMFAEISAAKSFEHDPKKPGKLPSYVDFTILREGGRYYAEAEEQVYEIDGEEFMNFLLSFGDEEYVYGFLPTAKIGAWGWNNQESEAMPWESSYYYCAIDGSKRVVKDPVYPDPNPTEAVVKFGPDNRINAFTHYWDGAPELPQAVGTVNIMRDGDLLWSGTPVEAREWVPAESGRYELEIIADFNTSEYYGGVITWRAIVDWEMEAY